MADQNVVKMSDQEDSKSGSSARCLSELVSVTMRKAAARLSSVDEDPIFREATARAGIRDFAMALEEYFPDLRGALAEHFAIMGAELGARSNGKSAKGPDGLPHAERVRQKQALAD